MQHIFEGVVTVGVSLSTGILVMTAIELHRIRNILQDGRGIDNKRKTDTSVSAQMSLQDAESGYAIFVFREGKWVLEADLSQPGYEAVPPNLTGGFEGQVVKKISGVKQN